MLLSPFCRNGSEAQGSWVTSVGHRANKQQSQDCQGLGLSTTTFPQGLACLTVLDLPWDKASEKWPCEPLWHIQPCRPHSSNPLRGGLPRSAMASSPVGTSAIAFLPGHLCVLPSAVNWWYLIWSGGVGYARVESLQWTLCVWLPHSLPGIVMETISCNSTV